MTKTFKDLNDGALYKLGRDVVNPYGDGRAKHDPLKRKVWPEGTRFRARQTSFDMDNYGLGPMIYFELDFVDERYAQHIVVHEADFKEKPERRDGQRHKRAMALMEALVDCEENWSSFSKRLGLSDFGDGTLRRLYKSGVLTLEQIETARDDYYNEDE